MEFVSEEDSNISQDTDESYDSDVEETTNFYFTNRNGVDINTFNKGKGPLYTSSEKKSKGFNYTVSQMKPRYTLEESSFVKKDIILEALKRTKKYRKLTKVDEITKWNMVESNAGTGLFSMEFMDNEENLDFPLDTIHMYEGNKSNRKIIRNNINAYDFKTKSEDEDKGIDYSIILEPFIVSDELIEEYKENKDFKKYPNVLYIAPPWTRKKSTDDYMLKGIEIEGYSLEDFIDYYYKIFDIIVIQVPSGYNIKKKKNISYDLIRSDNDILYYRIYRKDHLKNEENVLTLVHRDVELVVTEKEEEQKEEEQEKEEEEKEEEEKHPYTYYSSQDITKADRSKWGRELIKFLEEFMSLVIESKVGSKELSKLFDTKEKKSIFKTAFTHVSFDTNNEKNYDILEFKGDRYFKPLFTKVLIEKLDNSSDPRLKKYSEGDISEYENYYLSKKVLSSLAKSYGFGYYIRTIEVIPNEDILEDVMESFSGALYEVGELIKYGAGNEYCLALASYMYGDIEINPDIKKGAPKTVVRQMFERMKWVDKSNEKDLTEKIIRAFKGRTMDVEEYSSELRQIIFSNRESASGPIEMMIRNKPGDFKYSIILTASAIIRLRELLFRDQNKKEISRRPEYIKDLLATVNRDTPTIGIGEGTTRKAALDRAYENSLEKLNYWGITQEWVEFNRYYSIITRPEFDPYVDSFLRKLKENGYDSFKFVNLNTKKIKKRKDTSVNVDSEGKDGRFDDNRTMEKKRVTQLLGVNGIEGTFSGKNINIKVIEKIPYNETILGTAYGITTELDLIKKYVGITTE